MTSTRPARRTSDTCASWLFSQLPPFSLGVCAVHVLSLCSVISCVGHAAEQGAQEWRRVFTIVVLLLCAMLWSCALCVVCVAVRVLLSW